jgi:hypothetical protein
MIRSGQAFKWPGNKPFWESIENLRISTIPRLNTYKDAFSHLRFKKMKEFITSLIFY